MTNFRNYVAIIMILSFCQLNLNAQNFKSQPQKVVKDKKTKIELKTVEQFFNHFSESGYFNNFLLNAQLFEAKRERSSDGDASFFIPEKGKYILHDEINFINQFDSNLYLIYQLNIKEIFVIIDSVISKGDDPNYENKVLDIDPNLRQSLLDKLIYFEFEPVDIQINFTRLYEDNSKSRSIVYLGNNIPFRFFKPEINQVASVYQFISPRISVKAFNSGAETPIFESQFIAPNATFVFPNR
jgi:hypothetical protein